jgi:hypothetical protein
LSSDPAFGNTVTLTDGVLAEADLRELAHVWDLLLECEVRGQMPSVGPITHALHAWVYPSSLERGRGPGEDIARLLQIEASRVIVELAVLWRHHPGALYQLRAFSSRARLGIDITLPREFDVMFPVALHGREDDGGHEGWDLRIQRAVSELASEWRPLSPDQIAVRLTSADREAELAKITYPRLTPRVAELVASETDAPHVLLGALEEHGARPDVLLPVLAEVVERRLGDWELTLDRYLHEDQFQAAATIIVLTKPVGVRLRDTAIGRLSAQFVGLIDTLIIRNEVDADAVERLLGAPDAYVARETALALAQPGGIVTRSDLRTGAREKWRQVIVRSPADDYWYSVVLKRDTELFVDWMRFLFERVRQNPVGIEYMHESLLTTIAQQSTELRAKVIREIPSDIELFVIDDVVARLVSSDLEVVTALFERPDLAQFHYLALQGDPSDAWLAIATKAVELGWEPAHVVTAAGRILETWWGEASAHWQEKIDAFEALRSTGSDNNPVQASIIDAAVELFSHRRDEALQQEGHERTFGPT